MTWYSPVHPNESRAQLHLDRWDEAELDRRIQTALGYMPPERISNYLGVSMGRVRDVMDRTPYHKVKGLRDLVKGARR